MNKKPADGVTTEPRLYGGEPNEAGWFPIFAKRDGELDVVGAAHVREGVTFEEAQAAWQKNTPESLDKAFDRVIDRDTLLLEGLPDLAPSPKGAPMAPSTSERPPDPGSRLPPGGQALSPSDARRTASQRATDGRSERRRFEVPPRTPADHARNGSRKGEKDGRFENAWWMLFAGYAKSFVEGFSELGVMAWDAGGALVERLSDDYQHDYLSSVGRAVGEQGQDLTDVVVEGMVDRIKAVGRMVEDFQRGDYYSAGAEAQSVPGPLSSPTGAVGKLGKAALGSGARLARRARAKKTASTKARLDPRRDPHRLPADPDGQPDFDSASFHDMRLDDDMIGPHVSDSRQFRAATKDLKKHLMDERNANDWNNFTPREQQALIDAFGRFDKEGVTSARIRGFRWHHDGRDPTVLRLVRAEVHDYFENLHYGGRFVTGGRFEFYY